MVTLQAILYTQVKMANGMPLFCKVHQGAPIGAVDVAERTLLMINKIPAACLWYYLAQVVMDAGLVKKVIKATINPTFTWEI